MRRDLSCVYFLLSRGELVYIGQSICPEARLEAHRTRFPFDEAFSLPVPWSLRSEYEGALIRHFRPKHNRDGINRSAAEDRDVLVLLGLMACETEEREALLVRLKEIIARFEERGR